MLLGQWFGALNEELHLRVNVRNLLLLLVDLEFYSLSWVGVQSLELGMNPTLGIKSYKAQVGFSQTPRARSEFNILSWISLTP